MGEIQIALEHSSEPTKSIGKLLIDFYEQMKRLETDSERGGKQATLIVMTISDLEALINSKTQ